MAWSGSITYGNGNVLSEQHIKEIVGWGKVHNLLPTAIICHLYSESWWGNIGAGSIVSNHNWSGITYSRPYPGQFGGKVYYSKGTDRPSGEGGNYVAFRTLSDFFHAHCWLVADSGIYKSKGKTTVSGYGYGLFTAGGASANYAAFPGANEYVDTLVSIEKGIKRRYPNFDEINKEAGIVPNNTPVSITLFNPVPSSTKDNVSEYYGPRLHPVYYTPDFHQAIDIARPLGTPIHATLDGVVVTKVYPLPGQNYGQGGGGYGNWVHIDHDYGLGSRYGHMKTILVNQGDHVKKGQLIGYMGSTGASTGSHLHFELHSEDAPINMKGTRTIDPYPYIYEGKSLEVIGSIIDDNINKNNFMKWYFTKIYGNY